MLFWAATSGLLNFQDFDQTGNIHNKRLGSSLHITQSHICPMMRMGFHVPPIQIIEVNTR
jgi:hypothetical protein